MFIMRTASVLRRHANGCNAVTTDRFGMSPIYTLKEGGKLTFARSVDELVQRAATSLTPDWRAWACQFFFGFPLGNRTHFEQISLLPPGETWLLPDDFDASGVEVVKSRSPLPKPTITDFDVATEGVAKMLLAAVERTLTSHVGKKVVCFLSGGRDSRALVACLSHLLSPKSFIAFTTSYDSGNDKEERFSERVATALGLDHRVVALRDNYYPQCAPDAFLASDFSTDMHVWMAELLRQLALPRGTVNFDGYAGDLLLRGLQQHPGDDELDPEDDKFFKRFSVIRPTTVLSGPIFRTFERLARDELRQELAKYPNSRRIFWFLLYNRGRRGVAHSPRIQSQFFRGSASFSR